MIHYPGRVSIIGAGTLGGTIAYGLIMDKIAQEILLVDRSQNIVHGQVLDLADAAANTGVIIRAGTFKEASQSSLIIVTADTDPQQNESREHWLVRSRRLFLSIASSLSPVPKDIIIAVTSDPVDLYVQFFQSYFPHVPTHKIFGIGTTIATGRFHTWISEMTRCVNQEQVINAYCIGNQKNPVVVWDYAKVKDRPISSYPLLVAERGTLETVVSEHRTHLIRERKGKACYGTAAVITRLVKEVLEMQGGTEEAAIVEISTLKQASSRIWVLSAHVPRFDSCISWPVVITKGGITRIVDLPLGKEDSAKVLRVVESNSFDFQTSMGRS